MRRELETEDGAFVKMSLLFSFSSRYQSRLFEPPPSASLSAIANQSLVFCCRSYLPCLHTRKPLRSPYLSGCLPARPRPRRSIDHTQINFSSFRHSLGGRSAGTLPIVSECAFNGTCTAKMVPVEEKGNL